MEPDARLALDGQELAIAPEIPRPALDRLAREHAAHGVVVVDDLVGTEAHVAHVQRRHGALGPALSTAQPFDEAHDAILLEAAGAPNPGPHAAQVSLRASETLRHVPLQARW